MRISSNLRAFSSCPERRLRAVRITGATNTPRITTSAATIARPIHTESATERPAPWTSTTRARSCSPISRNTPFSSSIWAVSQLMRSALRSGALRRRTPLAPVASPAATTARTPEAPADSAGRNARKGTTKEIAVVRVGWAMRERTCTATAPTTAPMTTATATA